MNTQSETFEIRWIGTKTDKQASGDCTLLRWGYLADPAQTQVALIDSGRNVDDLEHLTTLLKELGVTRIDYLIGTHTDDDHIGQFQGLLDDESFGFGELWILDPFDHLTAYDEHIESVATASIDATIKTVQHPRVLSGEITKVNPRPLSTTSDDGKLIVLGPTQRYYKRLLPRIFDYERLMTGRDELALLAALSSASIEQPQTPAPVAVVESQWGVDRLGAGRGNPANNASLLLLFTTPAGLQVLFTGDAGVEAFDEAKSTFNDPDSGYDQSKLSHVQLPHHGAHANVSAELLDWLLGSKIEDRDEADEAVTKMDRRCIAMNGKNDPHHASGAVTDAAYQRGWSPIATNSREIVTNRFEGTTLPRIEPIRFGENPK